jgi:hypothetical protein
VAIFVYHAVIPGSGAVADYAVPPNPSGRTVPPLPIWVDLTENTPDDAWDAFGPDLLPQTFDDAIVPGTAVGTPYDVTDQAQSWQEPRQWILDQNNNIYRVLSWNRGSVNDRVDVELVNDRVDVELVRPVPAIPSLPPYYILPPEFPLPENVGVQNVVSDIWYIPAEVQLPSSVVGQPDLDMGLTPVYVMVREL